jgi:ABC-type hemin transport system ATPase subunit
VLLLDEPTVHLDPAHQRATLALVRDLARRNGIAAAAVLHDLNLASAMAERIVIVDGGRIAADGPPAAVLTQRTIERIFGSGLQVLEDRVPPAVLPRA